MTPLLREDVAASLVKARRTPFSPAVEAMGKVLEGRGHEPVSKDALAADEPTPAREPSCATCGRIFSNRGAYARHRIATGHGSDPERTSNEQVAANPDYDAEPLSKAALVGAITVTPDKRHTLVVVTPDQFGTDPQSFQHRVWKSRVEGNKALTDDDGRLLGRVVEVAQWPFPTQPYALRKASDVSLTELPADSYYVGVLWEPEAWADIQAGRLSPSGTVAEAFTS
jgi:hypothetical protein